MTDQPVDATYVSIGGRDPDAKPTILRIDWAAREYDIVFEDAPRGRAKGAGPMSQDTPIKPLPDFPTTEAVIAELERKSESLTYEVRDVFPCIQYGQYGKLTHGQALVRMVERLCGKIAQLESAVNAAMCERPPVYVAIALDQEAGSVHSACYGTDRHKALIGIGLPENLACGPAVLVAVPALRGNFLGVVDSTVWPADQRPAVGGEPADEPIAAGGDR